MFLQGRQAQRLVGLVLALLFAPIADGQAALATRRRTAHQPFTAGTAALKSSCGQLHPRMHIAEPHYARGAAFV